MTRRSAFGVGSGQGLPSLLALFITFGAAVPSHGQVAEAMLPSAAGIDGADEAQARPPARPPEQTPPAKPAGRAPARSTPPAKPRPAWEIKGFGTVGYTAFAATDTFKAVLDESGGFTYGGGVMVGHRSGYFGQVSVERFSADGERVFVSEGEVFKLGIPLSVTVTPLEFTGGWRFLPKPPPPPRPAPPPPKPAFKPARPLPSDKKPPPPPPPAAPKPARTWIPYVGGGVGILSYEESSDFADAGEDVDETFTSYHFILGADFPIWKWLGGGLEGGYRWVPGALDDSPLAQEFEESDLGGFVFRVRVTVGS